MRFRGSVGRDAVAAVLARASRHAASATLIATLVPLGVVAGAGPARALAIAPFVVGAPTVGPSTQAGDSVYTYIFSTLSPAVSITAIEIPEAVVGALTAVGAGGTSLPTGWTETTVLTPTLCVGLTCSGLKSGAAAADYLDLTTTTNPITSAASASFAFTSNYTTLIGTTVGYVNGGTTVLLDPQFPGPAVPEPGTLAVIGTGLIGLAALRRRRRA